MLISMKTIREISNRSTTKMAVPAFKVQNGTQVMVVAAAARITRAPVILAAPLGTWQDLVRKGFSPEFLAHLSEVHAVAQLDSVTNSKEVQAGIALGCNSVRTADFICQAGRYPEFRVNLETTQKIVELAHSKAVWVEGQWGKVFPNGKYVFLHGNWLPEFVQRTNVDALQIVLGVYWKTASQGGHLHWGVLQDTRSSFPDLFLTFDEDCQYFPNFQQIGPLPLEICQDAIQSGINQINVALAIQKAKETVLKTPLADPFEIFRAATLPHFNIEAAKVIFVKAVEKINGFNSRQKMNLLAKRILARQDEPRPIPHFCEDDWFTLSLTN